MSAPLARRAWLAALAAAFLAGSAGVASAGDDPFDEPRLEAGLGMLVGGFSVGPISGSAVGVHLDAGRKAGPLLLMGEYDLLRIGENRTEADPVLGTLHRVGVTARYAINEFGGGRHVPLQGALWLEAGAGRQAIRWDGGGILRRNDVAVGFGAQMNIKHGPDDRPRFFGIHYAFRALVANGPDADKAQMPTCAGPCDEPTTPSAFDLGLFFNLGLTWGR